jgi:hypothetical protein
LLDQKETKNQGCIKYAKNWLADARTGQCSGQPIFLMIKGLYHLNANPYMPAFLA